MAVAFTSPMDYSGDMEFEWDAAKNNACFVKRSFDFTYAAKAFFDTHRLIEADERQSYGEDRYQMIGAIEGRVFVIVFTPRQDVIRIISARKANQREVKHYENSQNENKSK
jgi:uncharacterized DUF497 family protein